MPVKNNIIYNNSGELQKMYILTQENIKIICNYGSKKILSCMQSIKLQQILLSSNFLLIILNNRNPID